MKKTVVLLAACFLAGSMSAQNENVSEGVYLNEQESFYMNEEDLQPLTPTYLDNVAGSSVWGSNWFLSVKGGASAFIGTPRGCGDIFDRLKPTLNVALGKWFTPYFGARLAFQGFKLYDSQEMTQSYQNLHVDLLYNVSSHLRHGYETLPKWDFTLFAGTGFIRNAGTYRKPFAMSYGLMASYRLSSRLQVTGELGGTTTWQSFDGIGKDNRLGDHLFNASIGLTFTIGKVGYQQVIDPKPYIYQNDVLLEYIDRLDDEKARMEQKHQKDALALQQMRKILEIEGLLGKYNLELPIEEQTKAHPRNNYSGLNSLRSRLRNKNFAENEDKVMEEMAGNFSESNDSTMKPEEYFRVMKDGKIFVGSPLFFFFKLATDQLTEKAQIINIREIASTIKRFGLSARIVGAADSQTGTAYGNERLSAKRADYIANLLRDNGVPDSRISVQYQGGINTYVPMEGNRNTCIMLYFK